MASKRKPATGAKRKNTGRKAPVQRGDIDKRWSILLFGLGLLFVVLSLVPGESGWAWLRSNVLFGALGISGWFLGPMLIYWAVLTSIEKPLFGAIIKGILFMVALSGTALVFSSIDFEGLGFAGVIAALHESGRSSPVGGGILSLILGASLLALAGQVAARILLLLIVIVTAMILTGVTPGDIVRFFQRLGDSLADRFAKEDEPEDEPPFDDAYYEAPAAAVKPQPAVAAPGVPPAVPTNTRMAVVDIPIDGEEKGSVPKTARTNRRMADVDIPLDAPMDNLEPVAAQTGGWMLGPDGKPMNTTRPAPVWRDERVDIDLGPEGPKHEPGGANMEPVSIGPGGTFGSAALGAKEEAESDFGLGDYVPLVPFEKPAAKPDAAQQNLLLFGEHDPLANLGGANSKLPPGNLPDVEYIADVAPAADPEFDLFNRTAALPGTQPGVATPPPVVQNNQPVQAVPPQAENNLVQSHASFEPIAQPEEPVAPPAVSTVVQAGAAIAGEPSLDDLLDKAAADKEDKTGADTRGQEPVSEPYHYPPAGLFDASPPENTSGARDEMKRTADLLVSTLSSFGVETRILDVSRGPSVTRYEIQPQAGVKISRITNLADDIALNLAAAGVRIEAPIPGKPAVGIEVPNKVKSTVSIRNLLESDTFAQSTSPLSIALGKDIAGDVVVTDLTRMPHLLVAGSTGSGKSVCINSVIMSFLYKSSPEDVRLILIDPKVVELAEYNGIPHLLIPVVTEPKQAAKALGYAVNEMEKRYRMFAEHNVRDIKSYNKMARRTGAVETIPHIAIVIDELADLMMVAGKDVENFICRIAQKARAAGMHLIVATQRPSVDVITGLIKSNIPSRIAFAVSSQVDSRTILDGGGAEKLLGMGDMLFMPIGANKPVRVQGTYVKDKEISRVLDFVKQNGMAKYDADVIAEMDKIALSGAAGAGDKEEGEDLASLLGDETFISAVEMAIDAGEISTSGLQRRLRLGYARAGRMVDQMEQMGIVSEPSGSKPRQVLISRQQWQEMVMNAGE